MQTSVVMEKPGGFQHLQVTRRCRPGVFEQRRNSASAHLAALEVQRHQNEPPCGMRKRLEDRLVRVRKRLGRLLGQGMLLSVGGFI